MPVEALRDLKASFALAQAVPYDGAQRFHPRLAGLGDFGRHGSSNRTALTRQRRRTPSRWLRMTRATMALPQRVRAAGAPRRFNSSAMARVDMPSARNFQMIGAIASARSRARSFVTPISAACRQRRGCRRRERTERRLGPLEEFGDGPAMPPSLLSRRYSAPRQFRRDFSDRHALGFASPTAAEPTPWSRSSERTSRGPIAAALAISGDEPNSVRVFCKMRPTDEGFHGRPRADLMPRRSNSPAIDLRENPLATRSQTIGARSRARAEDFAALARTLALLSAQRLPGKSPLGLPSFVPRARAAANASFTRIEIRSDSYSAIAARMWMVKRLASGKVDDDELLVALHQGRHERDVAREPVEACDDQGRPLQPAASQRLGQHRAVAAPPAHGLEILADQRAAVVVDVAADIGALRLDAVAQGLASRRDTAVGDEPLRRACG